ncbi:branched-chain amino acid ABC transporter permease [Derxia lacustris]|uniref:branched-chain amino acid ABC transporter permease n=1 Tax=Derxia lacustris TaxID=764842 RepID=UPI000A17554B|nr:branched-chain amino acid ABC transporter permease [Derxia lacustris]
MSASDMAADPALAASQSGARRPARWLVFAGVAALTALLGLLLGNDNQWLLLGLLAGAGLLGWGAAHAGVAQRFGASCAAAPGTLALAGTLGFVALVGVLREEHFALLILCSLLLYATVCLGLNIQIGYAGVVNFSAMAFFGVGSYAAAWLTNAQPTLPHLAVLALAGGASALVGAVLLFPVLRTRGHYASLVTVAFAVLFRSFMEVNETFGGSQGMKLPGLSMFGHDFNDDIELFGQTVSFYAGYAAVAFAIALGALVLTWRIERSWIGLNLDAVRSDEIAAACFGIDIARWKITAFLIGNAFAGVAGALFALMTGFVAPNNFNFGDSLVMLSILVLGGLGNLWGILPATLVVILLPEKLQAIQEYRFLLYAAAVIAILLFRPQGLFPRRVRVFGGRS